MTDGLAKILLKAEELFLLNGVRNTTMDDLATALGISKKTLYLSVSNKEDLVYKAFEYHMEQEKSFVTEICQNSANAIDEMFEIGKLVTRHVRNMNPTVIYDVKKYYPEAWALLDEYKNTFIYAHILENIKKGIKQGYYRGDFNPDIIAKLYSAKADCVVDQQLFPFTDYTIISIYNEYLRYHIRGISSEKGLKYMEQLKTI